MAMLKAIPSEHEEQCAFVQWFELKYKDVFIYAIPNGGARNIVVAMKLKKEGVKKGVPDLFIPDWRLYIEMKKSMGGVLSKDQKDVIPRLRNSGYTVLVCEGAQEAIDKVEAFVKEKTT